jgi:multidrug efflux pump subunit AcrB
MRLVAAKVLPEGPYFGVGCRRVRRCCDRKIVSPVRTATPDCGVTQFRPALVTALAMIVAMVPMAFALGPGGEQNELPGRAVSGGLTVAALATLFLVPTVLSVRHRGARRLRHH